MEELNSKQTTNRRGFLGTIATGAAAFGVASIAPLAMQAENTITTGMTNPDDPEEWFKKIKGKHRIVFDATQPHDVLPFAWPKVFLMTNEMTGTPAKENSVVVVLRHSAIGYAMDHKIWEKYKLGELFQAEDPATKKPSMRNPFWQPKPGDFKIPGVGEVQIGLNELQENGVMFCVCSVAMTVYSALAAQMSNMDAEAVKKEWMAALLPGVQVVPSGVWALGRAQEHGCGYIFAG
jgi:hypothetical protein